MKNDDIKLSPKHGLNPTIPVCFYCGEEKNEVALLGKIDKNDSEAPMRCIINYEPCDKCKEKQKDYVLLVTATEKPQGDLPPIQGNLYPIPGKSLWAKDDAVKSWFREAANPVIEKRMAFIDEEIFNQIVELYKKAEEEANGKEV